MACVSNVLVVGGGSAGTAIAIRLAQAGVAVDLFEIKPDVATAGSGITLQGNALRVLRELGVWPQVEAAGFPFDSLGLRAPDAGGTLLAEIPDLHMGGADLPATCGIVRPVLAQILLDRARAVGAKVRFATTIVALDAADDGVEVSTADGDRRRYDLVIGADGLRSWTRRALGIELDTRPTGMGIWRVFGPRPSSVVRTDLFYGGSSYIAGYCPTGPDTLYAYIVERAQDRSALSPADQLATMRALSEDYHGPWDDIRAGLRNPEQVNYTWFETHLLDPPWNRGRVVLIGDAVHACPPTVAQGAAMALEDAVVLAQLLIDAPELNQALFDRFVSRRFDRAKVVVDASVQLGRWLLEADPAADVSGLMHTVGLLVSEPA